MKTQCVYCLDFPNGKRYVGSTNNLKRRLQEHRNHLHGKKINPTLKATILELGFEIVILEQMPDATRQERKQREQHYIDLWWDAGILLNINKNVNHMPIFSGDFSAESKKKMSISSRRADIWDKADEIKALRASGLPYQTISKQYKCCPDTIKNICLNT